MADTTITTTGVFSLPVATGTPPPGWVEEDGRFIPFWWSRTGAIIKWSLFIGLFTIVGLYLVLGYTHAKGRLRKGQIPMAYHRWMISRAELARVDPRYAYPQPAGFHSYRPDYYGMNTMPPPPVYDPNAPRPPVYDGPADATKVDPARTRSEPSASQPNQQPPPPQQTGNYTAPPPQEPPPAIMTNYTGSSNNPFRN